MFLHGGTKRRAVTAVTDKNAQKRLAERPVVSRFQMIPLSTATTDE